jgi:hypothetical protein
MTPAESAKIDKYSQAFLDMKAGRSTSAQQAYLNGYHAISKAGLTLKDNPYLAGSDEHKEWDEGARLAGANDNNIVCHLAELSKLNNIGIIDFAISDGKIICRGKYGDEFVIEISGGITVKHTRSWTRGPVEHERGRRD